MPRPATRNGYAATDIPPPVRIAHFNNWANVAWTLSRAQRALGHEAVVYELWGNPYGFPADVRVGFRGPTLWNYQMARRAREFASFDVLHVHGGIRWQEPAYPLFAGLFGKTLAVHLHGTETRAGYGRHYLAAADVIFASTPDLREHVPAAAWLPNPIDLSALPAPGPPNEPPRFGHFVSSPVHKGTEAVVAAFRVAFPDAQVSEEGTRTRYRARDAELLVVFRAPHAEALALMASCDAVVDQIAPYGIYGVVAIEAMALGKPVLASHRPGWYPGCPVVRIGGDTAAEEMRALAADPARRRRLGAEGRAYVERVHAASVVAARTVDAYRSARG